MNNRTKEIKIRLSISEFNKLKENVKLTSLSREAYVRSLLNGYLPKAQSSADFHEVIAQLRAIGNNLNQIAMVANRSGYIDSDEYKKVVKQLRKEILEIRQIVCEPIKLENGNNSNMGC